MRVLVTGGTGKVGRAAVARLVAHGHQVRGIGRSAGHTIPGAEYQICDIMDYDALRAAMDGMEGVVHLAAIPHPSMGSGVAIFDANCAGSLRVYEAAAAEGIRRVVSASSINAFGYNFGVGPLCLNYFPVDEAHPTATSDPYSFSKQVLEEIAAYYWRREGISGICMRLPYVYEVTPGAEGWDDMFVTTMRAEVAEILALAPGARSARVAAIVAADHADRARRASEQPRSDRQQEPSTPGYYAMVGRSNFWTSIDSRDSAQAVEKGLLAEYESSHTLFINDRINCAAVDSRRLAAVFFPEITRWERPVAGHDTLVSIDAARALIGYEPEYSLDAGPGY